VHQSTCAVQPSQAQSCWIAFAHNGGWVPFLLTGLNADAGARQRDAALAQLARWPNHGVVEVGASISTQDRIIGAQLDPM